jgi:hypothetical protein
VWEEIDQRVYVRSLARALQQQVQQTFFCFFLIISFYLCEFACPGCTASTGAACRGVA